MKGKPEFIRGNFEWVDEDQTRVKFVETPHGEFRVTRGFPFPYLFPLYESVRIENLGGPQFTREQWEMILDLLEKYRSDGLCMCSKAMHVH